MDKRQAEQLSKIALQAPCGYLLDQVVPAGGGKHALPPALARKLGQRLGSVCRDVYKRQVIELVGNALAGDIVKVGHGVVAVSYTHLMQALGMEPWPPLPCTVMWYCSQLARVMPPPGTSTVPTGREMCIRDRG